MALMFSKAKNKEARVRKVKGFWGGFSKWKFLLLHEKFGFDIGYNPGPMEFRIGVCSARRLHPEHGCQIPMSRSTWDVGFAIHGARRFVPFLEVYRADPDFISYTGTGIEGKRRLIYLWGNSCNQAAL